jgi:ATP-dependent protease Clp ATPase subunit
MFEGVPEGYQPVNCSFCGRPNREVHIVAGNDDLRICSVCVEKCAAILDADAGVASPPGGWAGRWPQKSLTT